MVPVALVMALSLRLVPRQLPLLALRASLAIVSTASFVAAVAVMPIADALAIAFVEPFVLLLLGFLFLGEQVGPRRILASTVGFAGALLVIQPNFAVFGAVALLPLVTACTFAGYVLVTRRLSREVHPVVMQFHTAWLAAAMTLPFALAGTAAGVGVMSLTWPDPLVWVWLVGVGVAGSVAHIMMTFALRFAPAATLAPLFYMEIVMAVVLGLAIFGDFPDPLAWSGIGIIIASGLYIIHRERQLHRQPPGPRPDAR
jgi:drug/metabolite transporter (DMT)-like permease